MERNHEQSLQNDAEEAEGGGVRGVPGWSVERDSNPNNHPGDGRGVSLGEPVNEARYEATANMASGANGDLSNGDLPVSSDHGSGDRAPVAGSDVGAGAVTKTEHSAAPLKLVPAEHSVRPAAEYSAAPLAEHSVKRAAQRTSKTQPVANKNNVVQLNTQRGVVFDKGIWKRSRKKEGYLIRRLPGYGIAETEYGISYLWVLSRKPDRTTADNSVHPGAGYFNWQSLESSGLLVKERKSDRRDKTAVG